MLSFKKVVKLILSATFFKCFDFLRIYINKKAYYLDLSYANNYILTASVIMIAILVIIKFLLFKNETLICIYAENLLTEKGKLMLLFISFEFSFLFSKVNFLNKIKTFKHFCIITFVNIMLYSHIQHFVKKASELNLGTSFP